MISLMYLLAFCMIPIVFHPAYLLFLHPLLAYDKI